MLVCNIARQWQIRPPLSINSLIFYILYVHNMFEGYICVYINLGLCLRFIAYGYLQRVPKTG